MEPQTTYTIKSIADGYVWVFNYDLNGDFTAFKISHQLTQTQKTWLTDKFPWRVEDIKVWQTKLKSNFEIKVNLPEITFDLFWKMYPYNALAKKRTALERWNKLSDANKTKIILKIPEYIKLKTKQNQFLPYAEVFIQGLWWDN